MHLGIDGNEANTANRVGSNIYAHRVLSGLSEYCDPNFSITCYLKHPPESDLLPPRSPVAIKLLTPTPLWTQWRLPLELYTHPNHLDLFFTPGHYAPRFSPFPTVITILDLAFLRFPETFTAKTLFQLKNWTRHSINHALHIFTISNNSKRDIIKNYQIPSERITVTYPGSNFELKRPPSAQFTKSTVSKFKLPSKYFLCVGTQQPRKNLQRAVDAINQLNQGRSDPYHLLIVGKTWHQFANHTLTESPYVYYTGYLTDPELAVVMKKATALIFPSLYEGFGIPVLEAQLLGTLVVAANSSSVPEITGPSPLLFHPRDTSELVHRLDTVLKLSPLQKLQLTKRALEHSKQFTWKQCVSKTYKVLNDLSLH